MSGEVISMDNFRKAAAMHGGGSDRDADEDMREANAILHKHLMAMLREVRQREIPIGLISMGLFTEAVSALHSCDWEPEEMSTWLSQLNNEGFFEPTEEGEEDE